MERLAFFATAVTTLISVIFGAVPGSYFGNGFEAFLAENIIRYPEKTTMEYVDHRPPAHHAGADRRHDHAHHRALAGFQRASCTRSPCR